MRWVEYERHRLQNHEPFLTHEARRRDLRHQQIVTLVQKQLDETSKQSQEEIKSRSKEKKEEPNLFPKSMADWTTPEHCEDIRELRTNTVALQDSLKETEKALGKVTLSLDCSETGNVFFFQEAVGNSGPGTCQQ